MILEPTDRSFFKEISRDIYDPLPNEEIEKLIKIVQDGFCYENKKYLTEESINAKDRILQANMRLAPHILKQSFKVKDHLYHACVSQCYTAFEKSILSYKVGENATFATYARSCAKFSLLSYLRDECNTVKLTQTELKKRKDAGIIQSFVSLDEKDENGLTKSAPCYETALHILCEKELSDLLRESIDHLNEREKGIIETRYLGLEKVSFREMSEDFGITGSRIEQIEKRAIEKIKKYLKRRL